MDSQFLADGLLKMVYDALQGSRYNGELLTIEMCGMEDAEGRRSVTHSIDIIQPSTREWGILNSVMIHIYNNDGEITYELLDGKTFAASDKAPMLIRDYIQTTGCCQ